MAEGSAQLWSPAVSWLGGLMRLWTRIGVTAVAVTGIWLVTWLVLVIIGHQSAANWVIGSVVGAVVALGAVWAGGSTLGSRDETGANSGAKVSGAGGEGSVTPG